MEDFNPENIIYDHSFITQNGQTIDAICYETNFQYKISYLIRGKEIYTQTIDAQNECKTSISIIKETMSRFIQSFMSPLGYVQ